MATMHDILDAQWMYDNYKDGNKQLLKLLLRSDRRERAAT